MFSYVWGVTSSYHRIGSVCEVAAVKNAYKAFFDKAFLAWVWLWCVVKLCKGSLTESLLKAWSVLAQKVSRRKKLHNIGDSCLEMDFDGNLFAWKAANAWAVQRNMAPAIEITIRCGKKLLSSQTTVDRKKKYTAWNYHLGFCRFFS